MDENEDGGGWRILYQASLALAFSGAAAMAAYNPVNAMVFLVLTGFILTAPYFFHQFIVGFLGGHMVLGCLFIISLMIPIVNLLILFYMLFAMFSKWVSLMKAAPFVLIGLGYAAAIAAGPGWLAEHGFGAPDVGEELGRAALYGFVGLVTIVLTGAAAQAIGFNRTFAMALVVGFSAYTLIAILTLFLPGDAGPSVDDIASRV